MKKGDAMKRMLTTTAAMAFIIGAIATSASTDGGEGQEKDAKILKDMGGHVVTVYKGGASIVNHQTGEPADGSEIAMKIRPGEIELFKGELVTVIQTDMEGDALPPGEPSQLVSHLDTLASDGALFLSGETVPISIMLDQGILKNPGPDAVHAIVLFDGRSRRVTIRPGDGVAANFWEFSDAIDSPNSAILCECLCRGDGLEAELTFHCDGSPAHAHTIEDFLACDCSNADNFTCDADVDGDGVDDITDGDVANCRTKVTQMR